MSNSGITEEANENFEEEESHHATITNQAQEISEFIDRNTQMFKKDPCFRMLKSFFDIFNNQLKLNFELRNQLIEEQKRRPINISEFKHAKTDVEQFIKEFSLLTKKKSSSIEETTHYLKDFSKNYKDFHEIQAQIAEKQTKVDEMSKIVEKSKNKIKELKKSQENNNNSQDQANSSKIQEYQEQIDNFAPLLNALRNRVQEKERTHNKLLEIVKQRREEIEKTKQEHYLNDESFERKSQNLKIKISKYKVQYQLLRSDEKPLIQALEDAREELTTLERMTAAEIESITQNRLTIEDQINDITNNLSVVTEKRDSLLDQIHVFDEQVETSASQFKSLLSKISDISEKLMLCENEKHKLLSNADTFEEQMNVLGDSIDQMSDTIDERSQQIEAIRKENNKIRSEIRVKKSSIKELKKKRKLIQEGINIKSQKHDEVLAKNQKRKKNCAQYKATMNAFETLRTNLGFKNNISVIDVAKHAIMAALKFNKSNSTDLDEIPERVSSLSVSMDLERISNEINVLQDSLE